MIVGSARTFLTIMFAAVSVSASFAQTQKMSSEVQNAKMSTESQAMVKEKLQQSPSDNLLVFDRNGSVEKTLKLSPNEAQKYENLADFLKSKDSPISDCKNPVPTPPPGCVMCDNGHPVCTKAIRGTSQKRFLPSDQDQRQ